MVDRYDQPKVLGTLGKASMFTRNTQSECTIFLIFRPVKKKARNKVKVSKYLIRWICYYFWYNNLSDKCNQPLYVKINIESK